MRSFIEKFAESLGTFSPIIILIFVCGAYLYEPTNEKDENSSEMLPHTMKQGVLNHFLLKHDIKNMQITLLTLNHADPKRFGKNREAITAQPSRANAVPDL